MKIDAHQHFWKFNPVKDAWLLKDEMAPIRKNFLPNDLEPILLANGFDSCVAVQADQSEEETFFLLYLAAENDFIASVVGWVDLCSLTIEERLSHFHEFKKLKGFRHILQAEDDSFMHQKSFLNGIKTLKTYNYTYDILVYAPQLKSVEQLVKLNPNQAFIIDHIAKPNLKEKQFNEWTNDLNKIAKHENVYCKISGMTTETYWHNWEIEDFEPYLNVVLETFGSKRVVYGSDWPVCLLSSFYESQLGIVEEYFSKFSKNEQADFFGFNAKRFYSM